MEQEFALLESVAKPILDRWQEDKAIPLPHEIPEIAYFLALLHTRVPRAVGVAQETSLAIFLAEIEQLKENSEQAKILWEKVVTDTGDDSLPFEKFREFLENPLANYKLEVNQKVALGISMKMAKVIAQDLLTMNWCLCTAPEPLFFLTCDAPVNVFSLHGSQALFGGGFALKNVEVAFPISPNVCLLLDRAHMQKLRRVKKSFVKEINRRVIYIAEQYIFSPINAKFVRQLTAEASFTRQRPKMDRELLIRLHRSQQSHRLD